MRLNCGFVFFVCPDIRFVISIDSEAKIILPERRRRREVAPRDLFKNQP